MPKRCRRYFRQEGVERLLAKHDAGANRSAALWALLIQILELWHRRGDRS